jgi:hypothetical protein
MARGLGWREDSVRTRMARGLGWREDSRTRMARGRADSGRSARHLGVPSFASPQTLVPGKCPSSSAVTRCGGAPHNALTAPGRIRRWSAASGQAEWRGGVWSSEGARVSLEFRGRACALGRVCEECPGGEGIRSGWATPTSSSMNGKITHNKFFEGAAIELEVRSYILMFIPAPTKLEALGGRLDKVWTRHRQKRLDSEFERNTATLSWIEPHIAKVGLLKNRAFGKALCMHIHVFIAGGSPHRCGYGRRQRCLRSRTAGCTAA